MDQLLPTNVTTATLGAIRCVVVGTGVIGLSTAACLLESGASVDLFSSKARERVSQSSCAIWFPVWISGGDDLLESRLGTCELASVSYAVFEHLLATQRVDKCGIRRILNHEYLKVGAPDPPRWLVELLGAEHPYPLPELLDVAGRRFDRLWCAETLSIDMSRYLRFLEAFVRNAARHIGERTLANHDELISLAEDYDIVFNCTGLGSRELANDTALSPVRGQIAVLKPEPAESIDAVAVGLDDLCLIGRVDDWGLGSLYDNKAKSLCYSMEDERMLLDLLPQLIASIPRGRAQSAMHAGVTRRLSGFRPVRDSGPRIENDCTCPNVVHNYGHGGGGVTLSWGSALRACSIGQRVIQS